MKGSRFVVLMFAFIGLAAVGIYWLGEYYLQISNPASYHPRVPAQSAMPLEKLPTNTPPNQSP